MDKRTKIFLLILGIVSVGVGAWSYKPENEVVDNYFGVFIGLALIGTVISIKQKNKEN